MIAALFVATGGAYFDLPDVDPWDEVRDARLYVGPHPVVAHPPCSRWCRLAGLVEARWGHRRGDDGGCFASALASVRRWGGCSSTLRTRQRGPRTSSRSLLVTAAGTSPSAAAGCVTSSSRGTGTERRKPRGSTPMASNCPRFGGAPTWTPSRKRWCHGVATRSLGLPTGRGSAPSRRRPPPPSSGTSC